MSPNDNNSSTFRQYLLGQLAEEERDQFEQTAFTDDNVLEELMAAEDELIEEAIGNELDSAERSEFEKRFLITADRKQNLQFRQALQRAAEKERLRVHTVTPIPPRAFNWISQVAVAVAALVIISGIIWTFLPRTMAERTLVASSSERAIGSEAEIIKMPFQFDDLKLHLKLPQPSVPAKDYRVEMQGLDREKKVLKTVSHNEQFVDVVIPASNLAPGLFALKVYAINPASPDQPLPNSYYLRVD